MSESRASINEALRYCDTDDVCQYLFRVHNMTVIAKGKRKRPSKMHLAEVIYQMQNVHKVLEDVRKMESLKKGKFKRKMLEDDEVVEEAEPSPQRFATGALAGPPQRLALKKAERLSDDVMNMLKAELALRGKTTTGESYPPLVRRLLDSIEEDRSAADQ